MSVIHQVVAYVGVGSNLQNPQQQAKDALLALDQITETRCIQSSSLYRSQPMGPADQPDYINAVAALETTLSARVLLQQLQDIEARQGRIRGAERWGPRTLDLDIILYNQSIVNEPDLVIPHPGMHERPFVLYPLHEIAPDIQIPERGSLREVINNLEQMIKGDMGLVRLED